MERIKAAVLGATGPVGQVFVSLLEDHPWIETVVLCASDGKAGKTYAESAHWILPVEMPASAGTRVLSALDTELLAEAGVSIVFSALPSNVAEVEEVRLRDKGFYVFSNSGAMRGAKDVPILIPEVNPGDLGLITSQGYPERGFIITNSNCTTSGLAVALAPLRSFGIREIRVSTFQATSGAGYPGLSSLDIAGNVIPFIEGEEEKVRAELLEILGIDVPVHPWCVRVPVKFGHIETVDVLFDEECTGQMLIDAWTGFTPENAGLPSSPVKPIFYESEDHLPQPVQSFYGNPPGMQVRIGRVKSEGKRAGFVLLVNNLVKGAAGGSIQNAELFLKEYGGLS